MLFILGILKTMLVSMTAIINGCKRVVEKVMSLAVKSWLFCWFIDWNKISVDDDHVEVEEVKASYAFLGNERVSLSMEISWSVINDGAKIMSFWKGSY